MRLRIIKNTFLLLVVLLGSMSVLSIWLLDRVVDQYLLNLVDSERFALKASIIDHIEAEGSQMAVPPDVPTSPSPVSSAETSTPLPSASPAEGSPKGSGDAASRSIDVVRKVMANYRLGNRGYAWYMEPSGILRFPRRDVAALAPDLLDSDRRDLPRLLVDHPKEGTHYFSGPFARYVSFSRLANTGLVIGVTYPRSEIAPLLNGHRQDILLLCLWLTLAGMLAAFFISQRLAAALPELARVVGTVGTSQKLPETLHAHHDPELKQILGLLEDIHRDIGDRKEPEDIHALTGLAGRNALADELYRRIDAREPLAVALADCTDFTAYNYKYGFDKGDSLIRFLAVLVVNKVREHGNKGDFIAHLEADHFVFVTSPEKVEIIAAEIVRDFDNQVGFYYSAEDRERGYILSKDRRGDIATFPIMTMTIGIATNESRPLIHPLQIAHICSEVRDVVTRTNKSGFFRDRRVADRNEATPENAEPVAVVAGEQITDGGERKAEGAVAPEPGAEGTASS